MTDSTVGVCVVGAGRAGMIHARAMSQMPAVSVVALSDSNQKSLKKGCETLGLERGFADFSEAVEQSGVDAVVVATPTSLHRDIVVTAANAGKHILCEKPMAINLAECEQMLEMVEANNVKLQIGFMRRFDKSFVLAKEAVYRGDIGEVVLVKSLTHGPSVPRPWQYDIKASNGPLAEVNSHDIDTLRWFTESEFETVYAVGGNYRCPDAKGQFPDFYDNVSLVASFANGRQGMIDGAVSVRYGYDARVEVLGTRGIIFIGQTPTSTSMTCSVQNEETSTIAKSWTHLFADAYLAEDKSFVECIIEDKAPVVTGVDGMMAVKVVNAGNESIVQGKPVTLIY